MGADLETAKRQTLSLERLLGAGPVAGSNFWRHYDEKILVGDLADYTSAGGSQPGSAGSEHELR